MLLEGVDRKEPGARLRAEYMRGCCKRGRPWLSLFRGLTAIK